MKCCLTGFDIDQGNVDPQMDSFFRYYQRAVGRVKISDVAYREIQQPQFKNKRILLAGICRNLYEQGKEPIEILAHYLHNDIVDIDYPKTFDEKQIHFLKFIYDKGGKEYKKYKEIIPMYDYPLIYGEDADALERVLDALRDLQYIMIDSDSISHKDKIAHEGIKLTAKGINFVKSQIIKSNLYKPEIESSVRTKIIELVRNSDIKGAISELLNEFEKSSFQEGIESLILLQSDLSQADQDSSNGVITRETYNSHKQKITKSFLGLLRSS